MRRVRILAAAVLLVTAFQVVTAAPAGADARPWFQLPATCGERWVLEGGPAGTYSMKMWPSHLPTADIPIRASAVGEVARFGISGSRVELAVDHGGGWATVYNMPRSSDLSVGVGQPVNPGQVIAKMPANSDYLIYAQARSAAVQAYFNGIRSHAGDSSYLREYLISNNCGSRVVSGGNGYLYRVRMNGTLLGYRHSGWISGSTSWDEFGLIGEDWNTFVHVVADNNVLYGVDRAGKLRWYERDLANNRWVPGSGAIVGEGWFFNKVIGAGNGVFYAITDSGDLKWYKRLYPGTNQVGWHRNSGTTIGVGWSAYIQVTSQDGVFYALDRNYDLRWYRFPGYNTGTGLFAPGAGKVIGTDWGFSAIGVAGSGVIHATGFDGRLYWYKHKDPTGGAVSWDERRQVGSGWL